MLVELLMILISGVIKIFVEILPTFEGLSSAQSDALDSFAGWLHQANSLIPIGTMIDIVSLMLLIDGSILLFRIAEWVISKIWPTGQMKLGI